MKAALIRFKIYHRTFKDVKFKIFKITDDLTWLHQIDEFEKIQFYWFTGYKDSANNEMFEGDIIKFNQNNIEVVGYIEYRRDRNRNGFYVVTGGNVSYVQLNEFFVEGSNPLIIGNIVNHRHLVEKR